MTAGWISNEDITIIGNELGRRMVWMLDIVEQVPIIDVPTQHPRGTRTQVVESIVQDALDFTTLDPQKITEEYLRLQRAARDTVDSLDGFSKTKTRFEENWRGDAADKFADQLDNIEEFVGSQRDHILGGVAAMGTAFSLSVQIRESYYHFAENMIAVCEKIAGKASAEHDGGSSFFSVGFEIVDAAMGLVKGKGKADLLQWGVDQIFNLTKDAVEKTPVNTHAADARAAIDTYVLGRDQLRKSFAGGLYRLRDTLDLQALSLGDEKVDLFTPLPAHMTDVSGPDFRYEHFFYGDDGETAHGQEVDQERKKYLEEKPKPQTPIERKLAGEA